MYHCQLTIRRCQASPVYDRGVMPNVTVSERRVSPKLDLGLSTGLLAGAVVFVWMFLVGALGKVGAAGYPAYLSSLVGGSGAFDHVGFGVNWLVGSVVHFALFVLIGITFALLWPRIRKYGTWTPSILFSLAAYLVIFQVAGRIIQPELASHLGGIGLPVGFLLAGFMFAYRYRRA